MSRLGHPLILLLFLLLTAVAPAQDVPDLTRATAPAAALAQQAPSSPTPFSSTPLQALIVVVAACGAFGFVRGLLPGRWKVRWVREPFTHLVRLGWLAIVPALLLDGLVFFLGNEYSHAWAIFVFTLAGSPFVAGLQWEKPWWNPRRRREEPYVPALNYYLGLLVVMLIPALCADWILASLAGAGRFDLVLVPLNLLVIAALAATVAFCVARLVKLLVLAVALPHRTARFFLHPASRFYAIILILALVGMTAFNSMTVPFFLEVIGYTLGPWPAITLDQALIILIPNIFNVICVTYFSIFAGCFMSMLPIILFSRSLRKKPEPPPALDVLLNDPAASRAYLGRELNAADLWPTIVTITAYNEPAEPLEKTLYGYLKVAREWVNRGLPLDRYIILFSHQTEREEDRLEFEAFLRDFDPTLDSRRLIDRDWARFDEDNPSASIRDESKLLEVLVAWLKHKKLDPESKAGRSEHEKRRVCQRMLEFSYHAPRTLFRMPDPPTRSYGPQTLDSWIWYFLIPKQVGGRLLQVNSKAHNLYYAREGIWGKAETSPLERDGIYADAPEWLFDSSDADTEIHASCVDGLLASYTPFYREPHLGWLQRLSYTIEPGATFLSAVKSASENAYWSWYLRARVHTYLRRGKQMLERVGDVIRPIRRDFQAANGHNMVVRGSSVRAAGGDLEHEMATVYAIESPLKRWLTRLRGQPVPRQHTQIEKWVPTGEDLELATRMSLKGYYGDYATYAPQGEGSPADFRGNVPQAIRWSGNNVQLMFMHLGSLFSSSRLTFNEKMGYFVNLATLASAPLLYIAVLRAVIMPFLDIPDAYASVHAGFGPFAFILALAPNFLLLSLALSGQLVVKPTEPWQRSVLKAEHRTALEWIGCLFLPPATIAAAVFLPGWLATVDVHVPDGLAWGIVLAAININLLLFIFKRDVFASLAYCVLLLPFLQVLYLSWIIFGIIGCVNMIVKTQIVEPYLSRFTGTFHPPVAGRYPSDSSGRFLTMNQRFPWLFAPLQVIKRAPLGVGILVGVFTGMLLGTYPPAHWPKEIAMAVGFLVPCIAIWRKLPSILDDWFLDRDSLANRWWDYWTNPQPAFVKTLKERQERSISTLLKDNIFGMANGLFILVLILHVHFVNAADFSAALLAYLTFSIAASWIVSPFFYEEPHRTLRSQSMAFLAAFICVGAFLAIPLGLPAWLHDYFSIHIIPPVLEPWLLGLLGALAVGALVNLAPWGELRAFAKRLALAVIVLSLLFLNALTISYRGVSIEPLLENWALEADAAFQTEAREGVFAQAQMADLERQLARAEKTATLSLSRERLAVEWQQKLRSKQLPEAVDAVAAARRNLEIETERLDLATERARFRDTFASAGTATSPALRREQLLDASIARTQEDLDRRRNNLDRAVETLAAYRRRLASAELAAPAAEATRTLTDQIASFVTEIEQPLQRELEEAETFLARMRALRGAPHDPSSPPIEIEILPVGDLHAAQQSKERAEAELGKARNLLQQVEIEVAAASAAVHTTQSNRQASWDQKTALEERIKAAWGRQNHLLAMKTELRNRSRHAFWTQPRKYEAFQRDLSRLRPLLDSASHRQTLAEALRWVASQHWIHALTLGGGSWYPRSTVLDLLESELPLVEQKLASDEKSAREYDQEFLLALAVESLRASLCLIDSLGAQSGLNPPSAALRQALVELESTRATDAGRGTSFEARLAAALVAKTELEALAPILAAARAARNDVPDLRLTTAAVETARCALAACQATAASAPQAFLQLRNGQLQENHRQALQRLFDRTQRDRLETRLAELGVWKKSLASATAARFGAAVLGLLAFEPVDAADSLAAADDCLTLPGQLDIVEALDDALRAHQTARKTKLRLEELADRIIAEVDRLAPALIGELSSESEPTELPLPVRLLARLQATAEKDLDEALEALVLNLDEDAERLTRHATTAPELERDRELRQLLDLLLATRAWALSSLPGFTLESAQRCACAWKLTDSINVLRQLFVPAATARPGEGNGLVNDLEAARGEAAQARMAALESPGSATAERLATRKKIVADELAVRVSEAWKRVSSNLEEARQLEALIWKQFKARLQAEAGAEITLAGLLTTSLSAIEDSVSPGEVLTARLAGIKARIADLERDGPSAQELRSLLEAPAAGAAGLDAELAELSDRVAELRSDANRLRTTPPSDVTPNAEGGNRNGPTPQESSASAAPVADSALAARTLLPVPVEVAVDEALAHAREAGGPLHLAGKDIDLAAEELKSSLSRFYPEIFGTLGGNSSAPAVFQGGGFALVRLSLDQLKNRDAFQHHEDEKRYLLELAELITVLKTLRTYAEAAAAQINAARLTTAFAALAARLDEVQDVADPGAGSGAWLRLERERLEAALLAAQMLATSKARALSVLLGRPPGEEVATTIGATVAPGVSTAELLASMKLWLAGVRSLVEQRFPNDPAFQTTLAALEKYDSQGEEADLKGSWPALHAGAGLVAPNTNFFSAGASLLFPIVDRTADLDLKVAGSGRVLTLRAEDTRTLRERLNRDVARARQREAEEKLARESATVSAHEDLLARCLEDHLHGFNASAAQLAEEARGLRAVLETRGDAVEGYLLSGLELVETGARLTPVEASAPGTAESPAIAEQRERVALAGARLAREDRLVDRFGVGAGFSYSTLLLPLPSVELTYGSSTVRRQAEATGQQYETARLETEETRVNLARIKARLDWLRDAALAALLGERAALRREGLEMAVRREQRGLEPPVTVAGARRRSLEVESLLTTAQGQAAASSAAHRELGANPADLEATSYSRSSIDQDIAVEAPALQGLMASTARTALARQAEYRLHKLAAALENKKPYGGNIGNFISPVWDTVRLFWHRPGSPEEIQAALDQLVESARQLEAAAETDEQAAKGLRQALDAAKSALGGDAFEPREVEAALIAWHEAAIALAAHDEEIETRRRLAHLEHTASLAALAANEEQSRRLQTRLEELRATASLGRPDPLGEVEIRDQLLEVAAVRARTLWRYARARLDQIYYSGSLEVGQDVVTPPRLGVTLSALQSAYADNDPGARAAAAAIASRQRHQDLLRRLDRVRLSLPVVLPSLGVDPRFGGSGLATSMNISGNLDRYRWLDANEPEIAALGETKRAIELEASLEAIQDGLAHRNAQELVQILERDVDAQTRGLAVAVALEDVGEARSRETSDAEASVAASRRDLDTAREELRLIAERIDLRAGRPVDLSAADAELAAMVKGDSLATPWNGEKIGSGAPEVRKADHLAQAARTEAEWRQLEKWLQSRIELIASLGQSPRTVDAGGGGFLAVPLSHLLGWSSSLQRTEEIRAEMRESEKARWTRDTDTQLDQLARELKEWQQLLSRRDSEAKLAMAAFGEEQSLLELGRRAPTPTRFASRQLLESLTAVARARLGFEARWNELAQRLDACGGPPPPTLPFPVLPAPLDPRNGDLPDDDCRQYAQAMVEEGTQLPRGNQLDRELGERRIAIIKGELQRADTTPLEEVARKLSLADGISAALGALQDQVEHAATVSQLEALRSQLQAAESRALALAVKRTLDEPANTTTAVDIDAEWEKLLPGLLAIDAVKAALRTEHRRGLEKKRAGLELDRQRLLADDRPADARGADLRQLAIASLAQPAELSAAQLERTAARLAQVKTVMDDLLEARYLDTIAREDLGHVAHQREEVVRIDLHGKNRHAIDELTSLLRELKTTSPPLFQRVALWFRQEQISIVEARLRGLAPQANPGEEAIQELQARARQELPEDFRQRFDRIVALRSELGRFSRASAAGQHSMRRERDVIARELGSSRSADAARQAARIQATLSQEVASLFTTAQLPTFLASGLEILKRRQRTVLEAEQSAMQADLAQLAAPDVRRRRWLAEEALEVLARLEQENPGSKLNLPPAATLNVARGLAELRLQAVHFRLALNAWIARPMPGGDATGAASKARAAQARDLLANRTALAATSTRVSADWTRLLEAVEALPPRQDGVAWKSLWLDTIVERRASARYNLSRAESHFARRIPALTDCLAGDDQARREQAAQALNEQFSTPHLPGKEISSVLSELESASRLGRQVWAAEDFFLSAQQSVGDLRSLVQKSAAREAAALFDTQEEALTRRLLAADGEPAGLEFSVARFDQTVEAAARQEALAQARFRRVLARAMQQSPSRFLRAVLNSGVESPSAVRSLARLQSAQETLAVATAAARDARLALARARNELLARNAFAHATTEVEKVRRAIHAEISSPEERRLARPGYEDGRGRLLTLSGLVRRDLHRTRKAIEVLAESDYFRFTRKPVTTVEVQTFLDKQLLPGVEVVGAPWHTAYSQTYTGSDESFTAEQALHALTCVMLQRCQWDEEGYTKAEMLLRPYALRAAFEKESTGTFRGIPRRFLLSTRDVIDPEVELADNAMVAIAVQMHAGSSGSTAFVDLARDITRSVLVPAVDAGFAALQASRQERSRVTAGDVALLAAALENQAALERALGDQDSSRRCSLAAHTASSWLLDHFWNEELGVFGRGEPARLDARSHLLALAVLARDPRFTTAQTLRGIRSIKERFQVKAEARERFDASAFQGNWFFSGPIDGYQRFLANGLAPLLGWKTMPEIRPADAWYWINSLLYRRSGGRLGFQIDVTGLAADASKRGVDFAATAQSVWVLNLLGRHIEETTRETRAEDAFDLAREYARELAQSTLPHPRHPLERGWASGHRTQALEPSTAADLSQWIATAPACHWVLASAVRRGIHPLIATDFSQLATAVTPDLQPLVTAVAGVADGPAATIAMQTRRALAELKQLQARLMEETRLHASANLGAPVSVPVALSRATRWLENRIDARTDLPLTNDDPSRRNASDTYTTALAITHLSHAAAMSGDQRQLDQARRIWNAMQRVRRQDGNWADAYDARTGAVYSGATNRATGPNSWMVLAGLHLHAASGDGRVLEQARTTLDWVLSFQDRDPTHGSHGAITLGEVPYPGAISTEANADALAAAWGGAVALGLDREGRTYRDAAVLIARWLVDRAWVETVRRFATGSQAPDGRPNDGDEWLDSQTWTLLALEATRDLNLGAAGARSGLEAMADRITTVDYHGKTLRGFAKKTLGPPAFWSEGVAGYVLAARRQKLPTEAFLDSLFAVRAQDGSLPHIVGSEDLPQWFFNLRVPAIDGTLWAAWADPQVDFNPFQIGMGPRQAAVLPAAGPADGSPADGSPAAGSPAASATGDGDRAARETESHRALLQSISRAIEQLEKQIEAQAGSR